MWDDREMKAIYWKGESTMIWKISDSLSSIETWPHKIFLFIKCKAKGLNDFWRHVHTYSLKSGYAMFKFSLTSFESQSHGCSSFSSFMTLKKIRASIFQNFFTFTTHPVWNVGLHKSKWKFVSAPGRLQHH